MEQREECSAGKAWIVGLLVSLVGAMLPTLFFLLCVPREVVNPWATGPYFAPLGIWIGIPAGLWVWKERRAAIIVLLIFSFFAAPWALGLFLTTSWVVADYEKQQRFEEAQRAAPPAPR